MPTVSWGRAKAGSQPVTENSEGAAVTPEGDPQAVALATQGSMAVGPVNDPVPENQGEWDASMNRDPYMSLFSNRSEQASELPEWIGQWVVKKEVAIGKEIVFIPVFLRHWFEEETEFGSGEIPERWDTVSEARVSGKKYKMVGEIQMLVEVPEAKKDDMALSQYTADFAGKWFIPVKYMCRSTAFSVVYSELRSAHPKNFLKGRYANGMYRLSSDKKPHPKGAYLVPKLRIAGATPQDISDAIREKFKV